MYIGCKNSNTIFREKTQEKKGIEKILIMHSIISSGDNIITLVCLTDVRQENYQYIRILKQSIN